MAVGSAGSKAKSNAAKPHWYDDGDVILEVKGDPPTSFKVHKFMLSLNSQFFKTMFQPGSTWVENHKDGFETAKVTIEQEKADRILLFLDWIYPIGGRPFSEAVLKDMLYISDRYLCSGIRATCQNLAPSLPDSFELLEMVFNNRLDEVLCHRLAAWAIQQPNLFEEKCMLDGYQPWKLFLYRLTTLYSSLRCNNCKAVIINAVSDPKQKQFHLMGFRHIADTSRPFKCDNVKVLIGKLIPFKWK